MSGDTRRREIAIGELAEATGLSVRTVRFYCDEGLVAARRSTGGHRMFDASAAIERVTAIRRLRALGLGLVVIGDVLNGRRSLDDAVAEERAAVERSYRELSWRRASLRAVEAAAPGERAATLAILAGAADGGAAHDSLVRFWRGILAPMAAEQFDGLVSMDIPPPPADPAVEQVLAYAEIIALVADGSMYAAVRQQIWRSGSVRDRRGLLDGVGEACGAVIEVLPSGERPRPGPELDGFVAAHAEARRARDTPDFRRQLLVGATDADRRIARYWTLTETLTGTPISVGRAHDWLYEALRQSVSTEGCSRLPGP
ncbi:MerR family transcriptional regulator [Nocardia amikacinitolerans]|uniref:MerR family transcriptional regulator n=1 Tax=Nocardia amikacinitolerans TaxID=756689 RepID=UPI0020A58C3C|nr:MerR family transcriptional regulator [Nocardia amikacinitolerans]MCP2275645.1 DNA-binding transcriptional regulator, MerR family [Nocardia amikacinitolerans]